VSLNGLTESVEDTRSVSAVETVVKSAKNEFLRSDHMAVMMRVRNDHQTRQPV